MWGIGLITSGLMYIGSALSCWKDNVETKNMAASATDKGFIRTIDRHGRAMYNGEYVYTKTIEDGYGNSHEYVIGQNTGTVYDDYKNWFYKDIEESDRKYLEIEKRNGFLAYLKYNYHYGKRITTEISTGKPIAYLIKNERKGCYRKVYLPDIKPGEHHYLFEGEENDYGIPITKREFNLLNIPGGTHMVKKDITDYSKPYCERRQMGDKYDPYRNTVKDIELDNVDTFIISYRDENAEYQQICFSLKDYENIYKMKEAFDKKRMEIIRNPLCDLSDAYYWYNFEYCQKNGLDWLHDEIWYEVYKD